MRIQQNLVIKSRGAIMGGVLAFTSPALWKGGARMHYSLHDFFKKFRSGNFLDFTPAIRVLQHF